MASESSATVTEALGDIQQQPPIAPSLRQIDCGQDVVKIAILGVESTGKTTLCQDLAAHFHTEWVEEYMRPYLQQKWDASKQSCEWADLMPIAEGQVALENHKTLSVNTLNANALNANTLNANRYLFCDTSLFELMVYAYWYYGACPAAIQQAALAHQYELILLTDIDVAWVADDLRDAPHQRHEIDAAFDAAFNHYGKPFRRIGGNRQTRVATVAAWLEELQSG